MDALLSNCNGCTWPPHGKEAGGNQRMNWCKENCHIYARISAIGPQLDQVAGKEKLEREIRNESLPEHHFLASIKNRPDAGTSDLDVAL
jgi:hypothetical protein